MENCKKGVRSLPLSDFLKIQFPKEEKHFTDIYQQANNDNEAIFCDSFLHPRCHEISKKEAHRLKKLYNK